MKPAPSTSSEETTTAKVSFKEFLQISRWSISLFFRINPTHSVINLLTSGFLGLQGIVNGYIFAKAIDALVQAAASSNASMRDLYPYLGYLLVFNLMESVIGFFKNYSASVLRNSSYAQIRQLLYQKLQSLGIQSLEHPEVNNKIYRANDFLQEVVPYNIALVEIMTDLVQVATSLAVVVAFFPLFIPLVVAATIPYLLNDKKFRGMIYRFSFENTEGQRIAGTTASRLSTVVNLQEIYTTNAFYYLDKKYMTFMNWFYGERIKIFKNWQLGNSSFGFLTDIVTLFGYAKVFESLVLKMITVGTATFQVRMLSTFQSSISEMFRSVNDLFEMSIRLRDTHALFQIEPTFKAGTVKMIKLDAGPTIEFKNVSFCYPRSDKFVFKNLNLTIGSGEKVALVGPNGVGKTTLVKLICRMYPVTEGEILINGTNVNELSVESWYQNLGVLFQDFNLYDQLTAKENIAIGDTTTRPNFERIKKAAASADALRFIEEFSSGWDQLLNPAYTGGVRPSTGQWQKLAIARFFYRNAPLCIFDEPTASIDAVSEFKIFNRIYSFFKGKTVLIVSHRFSTVRNADRIIVFKKGQIVEEGSHADLMSNSGHYKEAFDLQASGYSG